LALAALALVVFGAYDSYPANLNSVSNNKNKIFENVQNRVAANFEKKKGNGISRYLF